MTSGVKFSNINNYYNTNKLYDKGAEWIAWGLQKGAEKTGKLLQLGSAKLREQLTPEIESVKVDPRYTTGVQYARQAAGAACTVSAFLG